MMVEKCWLSKNHVLTHIKFIKVLDYFVKYRTLWNKDILI